MLFAAFGNLFQSLSIRVDASYMIGVTLVAPLNVQIPLNVKTPLNSKYDTTCTLAYLGNHDYSTSSRLHVIAAVGQYRVSATAMTLPSSNVVAGFKLAGRRCQRKRDTA